MALTREQTEVALALLSSGLSQSEVAERVNCSLRTIARLKKKSDGGELEEIALSRVRSVTQENFEQRVTDIREYVESQRHFSRRMRELADLLIDISSEAAIAIREKGKGCSERNLASIARTIPLLVDCAADAQARAAGIDEIVGSYDENQADENRTKSTLTLQETFDE